jgi:hypothetical protein
MHLKKNQKQAIPLSTHTKNPIEMKSIIILLNKYYH